MKKDLFHIHGNNCLSAKERQLLIDFNSTEIDFPYDKTINNLFQEQSERTPNNLAVVFKEKRLTYRELDEISNQLGHYLQQKYKIQQDDLVAIKLVRSEWMLISILGVLKSGGAYVPIDPEYPQERIEYIEKDTRCKVCINEKELEKFRKSQVKYKNTKVNSLTKSDNLAYVIYTSGSTGKPKGVMIEHRSVVNYLKWYTDCFKVVPTDAAMAYAKFGFDASVGETLTYLTKGACVHIAPPEILLDVEAINTYYESNNITISFLPTAVCQQFMHLKNKSLRVLTTGGDRLSQFIENKYQLINNYGPTETTVVSTTYKVNETKNNYPIGRPVYNTDIHILDEDLNLLPIGEIGEIFIGGSGLARGYLNQEEFTNQKFIVHPFKNGAKLYRTGDLGRWLTDGNIEFISRKDDQVKINGYRIELGEIESAIAQIDGVKQTCVLAKEKKNRSTNTKYLVGYFVGDSNAKLLNSSVIQSKLSAILPEYMIPSILIKMDTFPLTAHGKLNKDALPVPDWNSEEEELTSPVTEREKAACSIWRDILNVENIGTSTEFFRAGGSSILAMQASYQMSKVLECDIKTSDIFKHKTISKLLTYCTGKKQINIPKTDTNIAPLSFAQERIWFIEQFEEGTNAYFIPQVFELDEKADIEGLKYALKKIVERHEVLRSTIEKADQGFGQQRVHDKPPIIEDIVLIDTKDHQSIITKDINRSFDLSREYPIRIKFYTLKTSGQETDFFRPKSFLLINIHHIAIDGWSVTILQRELNMYYEAFIKKDVQFDLPPLDIQYKDYALFQNAYLTEEMMEQKLSFWREKLSGYQPLEFPVDNPRPTQINYKGASKKFRLGKNLSGKLRALARESGVTLYSVMLACTNVLLSKYTGQDDIVTGSPTAGRNYRQTEDLIGFFVNTQVNRTLLSNTQNFRELIYQVHEEQVESQLHHDLPFEKLVDKLVGERDVSRNPIFQIMFGVQNFENLIQSDVQTHYLKPYHIENSYDVEQFDFTIFFNDGDEDITGQISYQTSLFNENSIEKITNHCLYLFEQLTLNADKPYSQISLLDSKEYNKLIVTWNDTFKPYDNTKTLHKLFEEQAKKTPEEIAIACKGSVLTYRELNEKSNQLASHLRKQFYAKTKSQLFSDTPVALCLDRSLEMIVGILAVLKAGGAYVPIDPFYPKERINYILNDTKSELILTKKDLAHIDGISASDSQIVLIDLAEKFYKSEPVSSQDSYVNPTNLAYIIYTSGTTGNPKGVLIEHHSIVNLITFHNARYSKFHKNLNVALVSNYNFDFSVQQIFSTLLFGHTLHIISKDLILDPLGFNNYLISNRIEVFEMTPSLFSQLVLPFDNYQNSQLKLINIGGENLLSSMIEEFLKKKLPSQILILNTYGPTEATVDATSFEIKNNYQSNHGSVKIGKPINNTKVFVLDSSYNPVPVGIVGELYVSGPGLARGYLNRSDLTTQRFIINPFATETDIKNGYSRLYKTGDLVKWLADGNIEYIGRNDDQVKINGYRIELGEIESAMAQIKGIKQACVLLKENKTDVLNSKYIVAYYVKESNKNICSESEIFKELASLLPEYMLPSVIIPIESFPLTVNGKLDKRALPEFSFSSDTAEFIAPVNALETRLCQIYSEVLGTSIDQISTHQNFFRMGGNSILCIRLKHKLNQEVEFQHITVANLFRYNTIQKLISSIKNERTTEYKLQKSILNDGGHEIAIISVSGAFSGANNVAELWKLILGQQEGTRLYSKEECREMGVDESLLENDNFIPAAGLVKDVEFFDPHFWGLSPNESKVIDPQIRKFVEHCWFALESSGYIQKRKHLNIGVFAGSGDNNYFFDHIVNGDYVAEINMWDAANSNNKDALATKAAYLLGLTGPANSINTACSTSLVAVSEACQKLQLGICDMALAGGVSLQLPSKVGYLYQKGMILSADGHCRTFDSEASGTISGSGIGVVLLKRLKDAVKDGDHIVAIIKGYSINNDGDRKTSYTAPSVLGQSECIINAQKMARITSDLIDYIECHGTATPLGDPIEVQALTDAFFYNHSGKNRSHKTVLGAVKANIGHTDSAAGIAGLIKVCAMLENNILPGQVNFNTPNPELHIDQTNFEIIKHNREWLPAFNKPRLACVSSFGVGGTNAHVIVSDYNTNQLRSDESTDPVSNTGQRFIIPLSAKSRTALERFAKHLLNYLLETSADVNPHRIRDIAYTLQERREQFNFRTAYCVDSVSDLTSQLRSNVFFEEVNTDGGNNVVFMFPGQGVQYTNMAHELYNNERFFKSTVDKCINIANRHLHVNLFDVIYPGDKYSVHNINDIQWSPISLFIIEYALAKYLEHLGVTADAFIGHSFGEYAAATLAGVFSLEDAIKIVINRGKAMQLMEPGAMLTINATGESVNEILKANNCEIAVINSGDDIVASGDRRSIELLQEALEKLSIPFVKINGTVAGHSRLMDKAVIEFEKAFKGVKLHQPSKPFVTNLTGTIAGKEVTTVQYWCSQLRRTVQFAKGIDTLSGHYNHRVNFIEVGAGKGLSYFVDKYIKANGHRSIQTSYLLPSSGKVNESQGCQNMRCKEDVMAKLWISGIIQKPNEINLLRYAKLEKALPCYQFDYQKMWLERGKKSGHRPFNPIKKMFYKRSWERADLKLDSSVKSSQYGSVLVLIRDKDERNNYDILEVLESYYNTINYAIHQHTNNILPGTVFDFSEASDMANILTRKNNIKPIDLVIYLSSSTSLDNPGLDVFAVKNIFDWCKNTGTKIPKFISVSFDNYEVIGNENLQERPSIVYGATKSIPFEYFTSGTQTFHIDLSSKDIYKDFLNSVLEQNDAKDLVVLRGKYQWMPAYLPLTITNSKENIDTLQAHDSVFLITGGLGGVGHAYANHIVQKSEKCTLLILGRTPEADLRNDYKLRLSSLRKSQHTVIYFSIDIGHEGAFESIKTLMERRGISKIDMVLHAAGVGAKSALHEKSRDDINQVLGPKTIGLENLIRLALSTPIKTLVCCSSGSSIIPSIGNMEYTAANLFIDEMGFRKHKNIDRILTLNLNQVSDTGMLLDFIEQLTAKHGPSADSFRSFEFPGIMEMLLTNQTEKDVVFSRYDFNEEYRNYLRSINSQGPSHGEQSKVKLIESEFTKTEFEVAQIFGDILGLDQISIHDDFFKLGGNSILAIRVSHRISEVLATDVRIADLFKYRTANNLKLLLTKDEQSGKVKREKWKI